MMFGDLKAPKSPFRMVATIIPVHHVSKRVRHHWPRLIHE